MRKLMFVALLALAASDVYGQAKVPKTVRDYFMLLPEKYFSIECCLGKKADYIKNYLNVEDTANGYLSGHGDAAQEGFAMALFKRPNGSYLIGFYTYGEGGVEDTPWTVFLNYSGGRWTDVSRRTIPSYNKAKYIYELPRRGRTVTVFAKDENGQDWYKGKKLFHLEWKNGRFVKVR